MKHIKTFEAFEFDYDSYSSKYGKEMADFMLKSSQRNQNKPLVITLNSSKGELRRFIEIEGLSSDLSETESEVLDRVYNNLQIIKDNDIFYRLIAIDDINDIDKNNLGKHYTTSIDRIDDMFIDNIGIDDDKALYLVSVKLNKKDIDLKGTIMKALEWSHEDEVLLKDDSNVKILNIVKFN